jgi:hypothetical protein
MIAADQAAIQTHFTGRTPYFILIEEETGVRPTHRFLVGDDRRHRLENTAELREVVLEVAAQIRVARASIKREIAVNPVPGQCRRCGVCGSIAGRLCSTET